MAAYTFLLISFFTYYTLDIILYQYIKQNFLSFFLSSIACSYFLIYHLLIDILVFLIFCYYGTEQRTCHFTHVGTFRKIFLNGNAKSRDTYAFFTFAIYYWIALYVTHTNFCCFPTQYQGSMLSIFLIFTRLKKWYLTEVIICISLIMIELYNYSHI